MHGGTRAQPTTLAGYFDALTRAVFQPGLNWKVIEAKWPDIGRALDGFEPEKVADLAIDTALHGEPTLKQHRWIDFLNDEIKRPGVGQIAGA